MEKLLILLQKIKPNVDFEIVPDLVNSGILDSMDIVTIITEIEKNYNIQIEPDEIEPENFQSVSKILELIIKHEQK